MLFNETVTYSYKHNIEQILASSLTFYYNDIYLASYAYSSNFVCGIDTVIALTYMPMHQGAAIASYVQCLQFIIV